jgi:DNA-binding CsgD family transcriptional regulator
MAESFERVLPKLPVPRQRWQAIVDEWHLPPQEARIVELILRNYCDKQIAVTMGLKVPTVRTYLRRAFDRFGVDGRLELVLKVFAASYEINPRSHCHHQQ